MSDYLIRGTAMAHKVRAFAVSDDAINRRAQPKTSNNTYGDSRIRREQLPRSAHGAMLKGEENLIVQVKGDGPIGQIVVDANAKGEVRGYVDKPLIDLPLKANGKLDVAAAVGTEGFLYITKDLGLKDPYKGSVPFISGELAEDFTYYFAKSEQTPSAVSLGVLVNRITPSLPLAASSFNCCRG